MDLPQACPLCNQDIRDNSLLAECSHLFHEKCARIATFHGTLLCPICPNAQNKNLFKVYSSFHPYTDITPHQKEQRARSAVAAVRSTLNSSITIEQDLERSNAGKRNSALVEAEMFRSQLVRMGPVKKEIKKKIQTLAESIREMEYRKVAESISESIEESRVNVPDLTAKIRGIKSQRGLNALFQLLRKKIVSIQAEYDTELRQLQSVNKLRAKLVRRKRSRNELDKKFKEKLDQQIPRNETPLPKVFTGFSFPDPLSFQRTDCKLLRDASMKKTPASATFRVPLSNTHDAERQCTNRRIAVRRHVSVDLHHRQANTSCNANRQNMANQTGGQSESQHNPVNTLLSLKSLSNSGAIIGISRKTRVAQKKSDGGRQMTLHAMIAPKYER